MTLALTGVYVWADAMGTDRVYAGCPDAIDMLLWFRGDGAAFAVTGCGNGEINGDSGDGCGDGWEPGWGNGFEGWHEDHGDD